MMICSKAIAVAALSVATAAVANAETLVYYADLQPLNAGFDGNTAHGGAKLTLTQNGNSATLRVQMDAEGLPNVSDVGTHVAHIHGRFADGADPFTGNGGTAINSIRPTLEANDTNNDGYISFLEGLPAYGPVIQNLASIQLPSPDDGVSPLVSGLNAIAADNGIGLLDAFPSNGFTFALDITYVYDLNDQDSARQFNNLMDLDKRLIVVHGGDIPTPISDTVDAQLAATGLPEILQGVDVGNGNEFRLTAPMLAGEIYPEAGPGPGDGIGSPVPIPLPAAVWTGISLLGALGVARAFRR